jgi:hypothetical protein
VASVAKRNHHLNQLRKLFARANDDLFLQMVWAVDALQDDRVEAAKKYITFPAGAPSSDNRRSKSARRLPLERHPARRSIVEQERRRQCACQY